MPTHTHTHARTHTRMHAHTHTHTPLDADSWLHKRKKEYKREFFALSNLWHLIQHLTIRFLTLSVSLFIITYILTFSPSFPLSSKRKASSWYYTLQRAHTETARWCVVFFPLQFRCILLWPGQCACVKVSVRMCGVLSCGSLIKVLMPKFGGQNDLSIHKPTLPLPTWRPCER